MPSPFIDKKPFVFLYLKAMNLEGADTRKMKAGQRFHLVVKIATAFALSETEAKDILEQYEKQA
jgi:hypothetical protein